MSGEVIPGSLAGLVSGFFLVFLFGNRLFFDYFLDRGGIAVGRIIVIVMPAGE